MMAIRIVPTKEGMKNIDRATFKDVDAMAQREGDIEQTVVGYKDLPDGTKGTKDNGAKPIIRNGGVESIRRVSAPLLNPAEAEAISTLIVARGGETEILEESTR